MERKKPSFLLKEELAHELTTYKVLSIEVAAHLKCDIIDFANKIISTHSGHATDVTDQKIKGEGDQRE